MRREWAQRVCTRRGAVAVLAASMLVPTMAMVAFTVDIGYINLETGRLQATADASAMAGVTQLPDETQLHNTAVQYAEWNYPSAGDVLTTKDIEPGTWNKDTRSFTPTATFAGADAIRVTVRRTESRGNALNLFFAPLLGVDSTDITVSAVAYGDRNLCGPLVGIEKVDITGTPVTDSYNSSEGPYNPATAGDEGSLCSDGPIRVVGNATINGNANPGQGYETTVIGNATVTGNTDPRTTELDLPPVDAGDAEFNNDNDQIPEGALPGLDPYNSATGDFMLTGGQTVDLPPGTYYFDDFRLTGQATVNISGSTTIYVTGNLDTAGGNVLNGSQIPSNLKLLMTGGPGTDARIIGNADFHGVLYAPNTDVTVAGTGDLFGSAVGETLTHVGTGQSHYDEALDLLPEVELPIRPVLVQ